MDKYNKFKTFYKNLCDKKPKLEKYKCPSCKEVSSLYDDLSYDEQDNVDEKGIKEYFYKRLQMFVLESYTSPYDSYASDIEHKEFILICPFCGVVFHRYLNKLVGVIEERTVE